MSIVHANRSSIVWKIPLEKLNLQHYLPLFVDGVREQQQPYMCLATEGAEALVKATAGTDRLLPLVPQLILPLKHGLETREVKTMIRILKLIRSLVEACPAVGETLVPYYRQLLPVVNVFIHKTELASEIEDTLAMLEVAGGEDAFVNIKYVCPTYESHATPGASGSQPLNNSPDHGASVFSNQPRRTHQN